MGKKKSGTPAADKPKKPRKVAGAARAVPTFKGRQLGNIAKIAKLGGLVKKSLGRTEISTKEEMTYLEGLVQSLRTKVETLADDYSPKAAAKKALTNGDHVMILEDRRASYARFSSIDPNGIGIVEDDAFDKRTVVIRFAYGPLPIAKKDLFQVAAPATPVVQAANGSRSATA